MHYVIRINISFPQKKRVCSLAPIVNGIMNFPKIYKFLALGCFG